MASFLSFALLRNIPTAKAADTNLADGITVDSTLDTPDDVIDGNCDDGAGNCTLRAAIQEANANPDASTIDFEIIPLNGSVKTIALVDFLPQISTQVTIDGFTQDDAAPNTTMFPLPLDTVMRIELDGQNIIGSGPGISFAGGSENSIIRGMTINNMPGAGIFVFPGADYLKVKGNYIGTDTTGLMAKKNRGSGVTSDGTGFGVGGADYVELGGPNPQDRNIFSGNDTDSNDPNLVIGSQGVAVIHGSDHWYLKGNYIGIGADGVTAIENELGGITADYIEDLTIGGDQPGEGNIFSGNGDGGIQPDGVIGLKIQGNYVGTDYTGLNPVPNFTKGITLAYGTSNALIGGTTPGAKNIIAFNPWFGVNVWQAETQTVSVIGNSIHSNANGLGIDLSNQSSFGGHTPNDSLDADEGANGLINFPEYTNTQEVSGDTTVDYVLDVPAGNYRIEYYSNTVADASGYGEGEEYVGYQNITSNGLGGQTFSHTLTGVTGITHLAMTATEIDISSDGFGATSEFGGYRPPHSDVSISLTLTNPQDIAVGTTANYQVAYTNNGPYDADLGDFGNVGAGPGLIYDFVPADLISPSGYLVDGPFPGSYVFDAGNPNLTCLYAPAPAASMFGTTTDASIGLVVCWLTGADTTLEPGQSIVANINFTVAPDSDLSYTNYALGSAPQSDQDAAAIQAAFGEPDFLQAIIANPSNNFAYSSYPVLADSQQSAAFETPGLLPRVGAATGLMVLVISALLAAGVGMHSRRKKLAGS